MKTYFAIISYFYDNGKIQVEFDKTTGRVSKPENEFTELPSCDRYVDWFDTKKEAIEFAEQAKYA